VGGNDAKDQGDEERRTVSEGNLSERLDRLKTQIEQKRPSASPDPSARSGPSDGPSPLGRAMQLSTEFTAGVIAGGILGWIFDRFLGTKPWGMIVLLMLGFVTGVYNVMRTSGFSGPRSGPDDRKGS
jgi:ATP synthase protein I